jgi:hypothetical protein
MRRWSLLLVPTLVAAAPPPALVPQGITEAEMKAHDLYGVGCAFLVPGKRDLIALADGHGAEIKLGGRLTRLQTDHASPELSYTARARYTSGGYVLRFAKTARRPTDVGSESEDWPATMTITDRQGRVRFTARGTLNCGA